MNTLNAAKKATPASAKVTFSVVTPAAGSASFNINVGPTPTVGLDNSEDVEKAVYGYVRAIRALGRTEINLSDVSKALNLSVPIVLRALQALRHKGVKLV